jgi:heme-degrading monooxygenase HmoA
MIVRVFRAVAQPGREAEFERMLREASIPMLDGRDGLISQYFGRPVASNANEFVAVTVWEDLDSLRAFAGDDWEKAVVPEEERPIIAESRIQHYEVFDRGDARD